MTGMTRSTLAVSLAAALGLLPASAATGAVNCMPAGATFIAKSAQAELYSAVPKRKGAIKRGYFGCVPGRRPVLLTQDITPSSRDAAAYANGTFRVGGTWAAWVEHTASDFGAGEASTAIHVRSLAGAARKVDVFTQSGAETAGTVAALKVGSDGGVAFALSVRGGYVEIDGVAPSATAPVTLAFARGIRKASLGLGAGKATWSQDGKGRGAPLQAPAAVPAGKGAGPQGLDGRFGDCGTLVSGAIKAGDSQATRLARAPGGAIVAAGTGASGQGNVVYDDTLVVSRFSAAGVFDQGFGTHGVTESALPRPQGAEDARVAGVVVEPDGRTVVAVDTQLHSGATEPLLAAFDAAGKLVGVPVRPPIGAATIEALALAPDGKLVLAGQRNERWFVARLAADGAPDPGFGNGGIVTDAGSDFSEARALVVGADGTIAFGGSVALDALLVRLDPAGKLLGATTGSAPGAGGIDALAPVPGGGYVAAGDVSNVTGSARLFLGRYDAAGTPVPTFGTGGFATDRQVNSPRSIVMTADGGIVVAAPFATGSGAGNDGLVRYRADGARDASFGFRGTLGGTTSYGLVDSDLLAGDDGTLLAAQKNGRVFGISRFAIGEPALTATAKEPSVCAMLVATMSPAQLAAGKLSVGLRLRTPGPLHLHATVTVPGKTVVLGDSTISWPADEAAVAAIPMTASGRALLRGAKKARLTIAGGAPGGPARHYGVTLRAPSSRRAA